MEPSLRFVPKLAQKLWIRTEDIFQVQLNKLPAVSQRTVLILADFYCYITVYCVPFNKHEKAFAKKGDTLPAVFFFFNQKIPPVYKVNKNFEIPYSQSPSAVSHH